MQKKLRGRPLMSRRKPLQLQCYTSRSSRSARGCSQLYPGEGHHHCAGQGLGFDLNTMISAILDSIQGDGWESQMSGGRLRLAGSWAQCWCLHNDLSPKLHTRCPRLSRSSHGMRWCCHSCDTSTRSVATCGPSHADNWQWSSEALRCGARRQGPADMRKALADRWIVVAGDSIARFFFAALLRLASNNECKPSRGQQCPAPGELAKHD